MALQCCARLSQRAAQLSARCTHGQNAHPTLRPCLTVGTAVRCAAVVQAEVLSRQLESEREAKGAAQALIAKLNQKNSELMMQARTLCCMKLLPAAVWLYRANDL